MMQDIYSAAQNLFAYSQHLRRDFHRHPELGFQEFRTAGIVARELQELGLEVTTGIGKTGVVALLEGNRPGPVLMMRFDMDALPIVEETGAEYASQNPGVMHACGHDGHTAIGLTVARLLHERAHELPGTVKFVFQPAEEGLGGAESMIVDGALRDPAPKYTLGLHLWNEKPYGWLGLASGPVMAAAEIFDIRVRGRGGHGALPHQTIDPVLACAQIITALQSIPARNVSPLQAAVISVTSLRAGEAFNVIPPYAEMKGTIRTFEPEVRQLVLKRFQEVVEGVAGALGCSVDINLQSLTPAVSNDPQVTEIIRQAAQKTLPAVQQDHANRTMGSEDMAYFMKEVPGCFVFVGSANAERGLDAAHHHPRFDFDERALVHGAALMVAAAFEILAQ
jgi:amidohydrolase